MPILLYKQTSELSLFARVCTAKNLWQAWKRVKQNNGGPGIDGVTLDAYEQRVGRYLEQLRQQLVRGHYRPSPVRRVSIPKEDGSRRELGILTVQDRVAQRAVLNVLEETYERLFADCSFGYRPDRSVQLALKRAVRLHRWGYSWLVDGGTSRRFSITCGIPYCCALCGKTAGARENTQRCTVLPETTPPASYPRGQPGQTPAVRTPGYTDRASRCLTWLRRDSGSPLLYRLPSLPQAGFGLHPAN